MCKSVIAHLLVYCMLTIIIMQLHRQRNESYIRSSRRDKTLPSIYCPAKMENKKPCVYKSFTFIQCLSVQRTVMFVGEL